VRSGAASPPVMLDVGFNLVEIEVDPDDGAAPQLYELLIFRKEPPPRNRRVKPPPSPPPPVRPNRPAILPYYIRDIPLVYP